VVTVRPDKLAGQKVRGQLISFGHLRIKNAKHTPPISITTRKLQQSCIIHIKKSPFFFGVKSNCQQNFTQKTGKKQQKKQDGTPLFPRSGNRGATSAQKK